MAQSVAQRICVASEGHPKGSTHPKGTRREICVAPEGQGTQGAKQQVVVIAHKAKTMKLNVEPLYCLCDYANDELI